MPTFPRTLRPQRTSAFETPAASIAAGHSGKLQLRASIQVGRIWTEEWPPLKAGEPDVAALLAWIEWAHHTGQVFDIAHLITPGSGKDPNGVGGGVPLVAGASQSGETLTTDGWTAGVTHVVRAGDVIRIAGLNPLYRVVADASSDGAGLAALTISPPIPAGSSPADNAAITRTGCTLRAVIWEKPAVPTASPGEFLVGLKVTFREAP